MHVTEKRRECEDKRRREKQGKRCEKRKIEEIHNNPESGKRLTKEKKITLEGQRKKADQSEKLT